MTSRSSSFPWRSPQTVIWLDIDVVATLILGNLFNTCVASFSICATCFGCKRCCKERVWWIYFQAYQNKKQFRISNVLNLLPAHYVTKSIRNMPENKLSLKSILNNDIQNFMHTKLTRDQIVSKIDNDNQNFTLFFGKYIKIRVLAQKTLKGRYIRRFNLSAPQIKSLHENHTYVDCHTNSIVFLERYDWKKWLAVHRRLNKRKSFTLF